MEGETLRAFLQKLNPEGDLFEGFYRAVRGGENRVFQKTVTEAVTLDDSWVLTLEAALYSVEQIVKNPKRFIAEEESIVEVERARKTNAKTVRHLASHSRNVNSIDADGTVRPRKVLTTEMREELGIYENRFVCSLIARLNSFAEKRAGEIREKFHAHDLTTVAMDSSFKLGDAALSYKMQVTVKEPPHDKVLLERNNALIKRIDGIRRRLRILQNSAFYRQLSGLKPVKPPILKTNIIKMNVDYQNCYKLWLFVSSYTFVGYSVEVKEKNLPVDGDYYDDLTVLSAMSVRALAENRAIRESVYRDIPFSEPKEREYKVVKSYRYLPKFTEDKRSASEEDSVNEYYYLKMKDALKKATQPSGPKLYDERELTLSFGKFYRAVSKISNEMYKGLMADQLGAEKRVVKRTPLKVKEDAYARQLKAYKRYKLLSKLKAEELERTLKEESRELVKLEKAKYALDQAKQRAYKKQEAEERRVRRLAEIRETAQRVQTRAERTAEEMLAEELGRQERLEEEKRRKREEQKRARELRQLERLKEKYEGEQGDER